MKGIFIASMALCLGACASQAPKTVTIEQPVAEAQGSLKPTAAEPASTTGKVYLDDYDLLNQQANVRPRGVVVLGAKKRSP